MEVTGDIREMRMFPASNANYRELQKYRAFQGVPEMSYIKCERIWRNPRKNLPAIAGTVSLHFSSSPGEAGEPGGPEAGPPGGPPGVSPPGGGGSSFLPQQNDLPPTSSQPRLGSPTQVFVEASHSEAEVFNVFKVFKSLTAF